MARKQADPRERAERLASSHAAFALPLLIELAVLLETLRVFLPDGESLAEKFAEETLLKEELFSAGKFSRSPGEVLDFLRRHVPTLLRCPPEGRIWSTLFLIDEHALLQWLRVRLRDAREGEVPVADLDASQIAARLGDLEKALTRRLLIWAMVERPSERRAADCIYELGDSLSRHVRTVRVSVRPESAGWYVISAELGR